MRKLFPVRRSGIGSEKRKNLYKRHVLPAARAGGVNDYTETSSYKIVKFPVLFIRIVRSSTFSNFTRPVSKTKPDKPRVPDPRHAVRSRKIHELASERGRALKCRGKSAKGGRELP